MSQVAQTLPKNELPEKIRRELRKGETIWHSMNPCHVSAKHPGGKWIGQVRREERGRLVKYPTKGFATPKEALDYVKGLRPNEQGHVASKRQGEPSVSALYEYVKSHRQKRIGEDTKKGKESRWRLYIEPDWGDFPISQVTRRAAQEWVTDVEERIRNGRAGTLGFPQFEKVRTDLHALFECAESFSSDYADRKNPFSELDFTPLLPRKKINIESVYFAPIVRACTDLSNQGLCTSFVVEMFLTGLLSGLRRGEVMALCDDQLDFNNGAIHVDRAVRRNCRAIDPVSRLEIGPVLRQAMNLPKGGTPQNPKERLVPMSDQLAEILKVAAKRKRTGGEDWSLLWPAESGKLRETARFSTAWKNLQARLNEIAELAPLEKKGSEWLPYPKRPGWPRNTYIEVARTDQRARLPMIFEDIDFRDTRSSFASYMNELGLSQATREHVLGHASGLTNATYTVVTDKAFQQARELLTKGWTPFA